MFLLLLVFFVPSLCFAAEAAPTLTVTAADAHLYARQDQESEVIAVLERGEELIPLAQAIGIGLWYMVKTPKGAIGWVQSADVKAVNRSEESFREIRELPLGKISTWSAKSRTGRSFAGTWTGEADPSTGMVSGTWTLEDSAGKAVMAGTWTANKSPKGWNGSWSARVAKQGGEHSGSWSANVRLARDAGFNELFEVAMREVVGGSWKAGPYTGSWSISVAQ
jgi:hypothetical protein